MAMTRRITAFILAGSLLGGAHLALAQGGPHGPRGGREGGRFAMTLEENAQRLGLSEETLAKVRAIVAAGKEEGKTLHEQESRARNLLRELLSQNPPDDRAIMQQAERVGDLETEILKHRLRILLQLRPLLTNAQLEELWQLHERRFAPVRAACQAEIEAWCSETPHGRGVGRCLRDHAQMLSESCAQALDAFRRHRRGGR